MCCAAGDYFDLSNSESPVFVGRAVAAMAADPDVALLSGRAIVAAELAERYGFTDTDGRRPRSLRGHYDGTNSVSASRQ